MQRRSARLGRFGAIALLIVSGSACRSATERKVREVDSELLPAVLRQYADIAFAGYTDAVRSARELLIAIETFLEAPSPARLDAARRAWLAARVPYLQTEVFRFYDGPIDRVEGFVNSWPIDENYVESASGYGGGIIDDVAAFPELSVSVLASLNEKEGEKNVSTGFHVIEFLLWGRDTNPDGPGNRPFTDYVAKGDGRAGGVGRRRLYLRLVTQLLVRHLEEVAGAWDPGSTSGYRTRFLALPHREALALVIKGMGSLGGPELSGERLTVAYETKDQENEHSCFSDNTHNDVALDALGIQNACLGRYRRTDGTFMTGVGLCELIARADAPLGERLTKELDASVAAARAIPPPFDRAILGTDEAPGRKAVHETIVALQAATATLARAAAELGAGPTLTATTRR